MPEIPVSILIAGIFETSYMTLVSSVFSYLLGIPAGLILYATSENGIRCNRPVNQILGAIINLLRSAPFIILLVAVLPLTRAITGTTIGPTATIVPLVIASAPFVARMAESSFKEVDSSVIEAAQSMGSTMWQIIYKVLLPEARPSLIVGGAIAVTTILGYTAMAGFVGGGGLGAIAINYGYYRYDNTVMFITVALLVIIVQLFQALGMRLARLLDKRRRSSN